ncbi:MAG: hypothetical protein ACHQ53_04920 [Polyangiales bacterium]
MRRSSVASLALVAALASASPAAAQVDAQIAQLNSEALEAYQALDIDTARNKLSQAIGLAQQSGYGGPVVAQSFMSMGVVYVAGMNDRDQGLTAFVSAVCMQRDVQLDPLLSTPDVQQVFLQAQQDAQSGACGPGSAAGTAPPPQIFPSPMATANAGYGGGPTSSGGEEECPPGVVCHAGEATSKGRTDFARGFIGLQLTEGLAFVRKGMKADSKPKDFLQEVFTPTNVTLPATTDTNSDGKIDANDMGTTVTRYLFDEDSAWVPDADSYDDYPKDGGPDVRGRSPLTSTCSGDGKASGPPDVKGKDGKLYSTHVAPGAPATDSYKPSSYCVRVAKGGVVPNLALRLNPGYWVGKSFALSLPIRFQFAAGQGSMSHLMIGLRGEFLLNKVDKATGTPVSLYFGAAYGQIQAKPPPKDPKRPAPYAISGPLGLNTGVNVRVRFHRNFGLIFTPEVDVMLPNLMLNFDLSGGVEAAF